VAHPWWWMGWWQESDGSYRTDPWFDDFRRIPKSLHNEFAAAARENRKAVEINLHAMLLNGQYTERFRRQYTEYLAELKSLGVTLSIGSDCHGATYECDFALAEQMLGKVGIGAAELWRLPPRKGMA